MTTEPSQQERFEERYKNGQIPWDDSLPPPEVMALAGELPPGRGLDLGCGYGRTCIYLAQHGWQMDGVDFVAQAVTEAQHRASQKGVAQRIHFHQGSVADLHFLTGPYTLAVDVGCLHALLPEDQVAYRDELLRLLAPGATYLLFARLAEQGSEPEDGPPTMPEARVAQLFGNGFDQIRLEKGSTQVADQPAWSSVWYWFKRL